MYWNASALKGYAIAATDGDIGHVADILIDDVSWSVRWLIVDTGNWLDRRSVGVPVWALAGPDPEAHDLAVTLTRAQIETSPEIDGDRMLSPEREVEIGDHYSRFRVAAVPPAAGAVVTLVRPNPLAMGGVKDLVSLNGLTDATVEALDGGIGHVQSLLVDPRTWTIRYFVVHTGDWLGDKKVLIPPDAVSRIDHIRASIDLNVSREMVRGSPAYIAEQTVDGAYDDQFQIYYGIKWMRK